MQPHFLRKSALISLAVSAALLTCGSPAQARVVRIVVDQTLNQPAVGGA
jgi:hypothetical protein